MPDAKVTHRPTEIWKQDLETRRKMIHEKLAKVMAEEDGELCGSAKAPTNWSLEDFIDKYLVDPKLNYRPPDNWTINNLIANNEHALFRPYVFEDYIQKYGIEIDDPDKSVNETDEPKWTFKDFVEKYEPIAISEQIEEKVKGGGNLTHAKELLSIIDSMDSTDELLSLVLPEQSGRRWRSDFHHPQPYQKLKETGNEENSINNILLFMKQAIYEARDRMVLMQAMREEHRKAALYKMGYLFAKTDYACKIFSSLAYKSFRSCSMIRQKIFGQYRLFHHYMDIAYNIERLEARWFDVDILKDILISNDVIARKVILKDRNLTSPEMVVNAFDAMFIE